MRVVAKVQFTTASDPAKAFDRSFAALERWRRNKFEAAPESRLIIRQSGEEAQADQRSENVGEERLESLCFLEAIAGGSLQTDIDLLTSPKRTTFRCLLRLGSDAGIAPPTVSLRAPRFVREIVALPGEWTLGRDGERLFARCFAIEADDLPVLEELMVSPIRRLPIVIVSEHGGETLAGDLHERLGQDLCGLAHVVRLSTDAAWALTQSRGKEWSCYNGAVRLFWPFQANGDNPRAHPLWTFDQLQYRFDRAVDAREHLREQLARRILEASTFVSDDPAFETFSVSKQRAAADQARAEATDDGGDLQRLADMVQTDNAALRNEADARRRELEALRLQVEQLTLALRSSQASVASSDDAAPPATVREAVDTARRETGGRVVIAAETQKDIDGLNQAAGPPDKILRHLRCLGDLADALAQGPLGRSVPTWLKERGVDCSGESETSKGNKEARRFRTRQVNGEPVECGFHTKPADATSPDMCARIYFATATTAPYVKVGYIGRHDN